MQGRLERARAVFFSFEEAVVACCFSGVCLEEGCFSALLRVVSDAGVEFDDGENK